MFLRLGNKVLPLIGIFSILFIFSTEKVFGKTVIATGSGFFLGSSNYVITNYHLIHNSETIQVKLFNNEILEAEIALRKPKKDIAILKLNTTPDFKRINLEISDFFEIRNKNKVFTYGYPITDTLSAVKAEYSEGTIYSTRLGEKTISNEFPNTIGKKRGTNF